MASKIVSKVQKFGTDKFVSFVFFLCGFKPMQDREMLNTGSYQNCNNLPRMQTLVESAGHFSKGGILCFENI